MSRHHPPAIRPLFNAVVRPLQAFFRLEAASGIVLLGCAVAALLWVNLGGRDVYDHVLGAELVVGGAGLVGRFTILELVNDGLMTIFFFVVGMEIKRELVVGELRRPGLALLPLVAALGGMLVPALVYLAMNRGGPGHAGWGIPMATDIAFCIGCLTLLRGRVPQALIVFVTALAIFDDIGGILVIALFYGTGIVWGWLAVAAAVTAALVLAGRARIANAAVYLVLGAALWYALHHAGIHATIAGVVVGLAVPATARRRPREVLESLSIHARTLLDRAADDELDGAAVAAIEDRLEELEAPLERFVHVLHPWVAFAIMPAFALANSGVDLSRIEPSQLTGPVAMGAALGLFLGKQAGIFAFAFAATRLGLAPIPGGASVTKLFGVSMVAGIGFTVALFIANLAFPGHPELLDQAKFGVLAGSLASGLLGCGLLALTPRLQTAGATGTPGSPEHASDAA